MTRTMKIAVAQALLKHGKPVDWVPSWNDIPVPNLYGWTNWSAHAHAHGELVWPTNEKLDPCPWVLDGEPKIWEKSFSQFEDTFSGNTQVVAMMLSPVRCVGGHYTGITLAYEGSLFFILQEIFSGEDA